MEISNDENMIFDSCDSKMKYFRIFSDAGHFYFFYSNLKTSTSLALSAAGGAKKVAAAAEPEEPAGGLAETLQTGVYFALWYLFNIGYNIYNKQALNAMAYPWTIATIQMATGIAYFVPMWVFGLRKAPKLSFSDL